MKDWLIKYWLEVLFGVIVLGFGAAYKRLSKRFKKTVCEQKALKDGMLALLRSDIIKSHDKYMQREWMPVYALENVLALYTAYSALGGNGTVSKLIEDLKELPNNEKLRGVQNA